MKCLTKCSKCTKFRFISSVIRAKCEKVFSTLHTRRTDIQTTRKVIRQIFRQPRLYSSGTAWALNSLDFTASEHLGLQIASTLQQQNSLGFRQPRLYSIATAWALDSLDFTASQQLGLWIYFTKILYFFIALGMYILILSNSA